jgi:hypothetical protein
MYNDRSPHAKFQASRAYGIGCGMIGTFILYIEITIIIIVVLREVGITSNIKFGNVLHESS